MTISFRYMYDLENKLTRVSLSDIPLRMADNWRFRDKSLSMYKDEIQIAVKTSEKSKILDYLKNGYVFGLTEENKEMKREQIKIYTDSGYYKNRRYEPLTEPMEVKMEKKKIGRPKKRVFEQLELPIVEPVEAVEAIETKPIVETETKNTVETQNQIALGLFNTLLSKGMIKTFEISLNKNGNISFIGECEIK